MVSGSLSKAVQASPFMYKSHYHFKKPVIPLVHYGMTFMTNININNMGKIVTEHISFIYMYKPLLVNVSVSLIVSGV